MILLLKILLTIPLIAIDLIYCFVGVILTVIFCKKRFMVSVLTIRYESDIVVDKEYEVDFLYWTTLMWVSNDTKTKLIDSTNSHMD